jgi:hypothetical protein
MSGARLSDDSGQVAPLVLVFLLGILAVAGLVIDGGVLFASRRSLQSIADGAARAGAMAVDEQLLRESGGEQVRLDPVAARARLDRYLEVSGFRGIVEATVDSEEVRVKLRRGIKPLLLSLVGVREISAEAGAAAHPSSGILQAGD